MSIRRNLIILMGLMFLWGSYLIALPKDWLQEFEKEFVSSKYESMYMLLTFSGYSNVGHVAMMTSKNFDRATIYVVDPNGDSYSHVKNIDNKKIKTYVKKIKSWDNLSLFKYLSFGGISYRYYHIEKKADNKLEIVKYLSIVNPSNFKDKPDVAAYIELKDFFFDTLKKIAIGEDNSNTIEASRLQETPETKPTGLNSK